MGNQMSADANWTYSYDKEGNLSEKDSTALGSLEHWIYVYSANNLLTEVRKYNVLGMLALTVDYKYDAFGEMIQKDDGTTVTKYGLDGWNSNMPAPIGKENFNDWAILNSDGTIQTHNLFGNLPSQILGRVDQTGASDPSGAYFLIADRLNSIRDVINMSGTVKDRLAYDGFGNIKAGELDSTYRGWYAWTGRQRDDETKLQYDNARWYDASTGRWISQDPLGFDAGDSNLYRYVNNRATMATDPSGKLVIFIHGIRDTANDWMQELYWGMATRWKQDGFDTQIGVPFNWEGGGKLLLNKDKTPNAFNGHSTIEATLADKGDA